MSTMELITNEMKKQKISIRKLCTDLNINEATFSCWKMKDVEPRLTQGIQILTYLRIPPSKLIGQEPDSAEETPPNKESLEERIEKIEKILNVS